MSKNVLTYGWIGELSFPVSDFNFEDSEEKLNESGFGMNHEGTLIYSRSSELDIVEDFGLTLLEKDGGKHAFLKHTAIAGYPVRGSTVRQFIDLWYNGTDSNHAIITLAQFKGKL